MPGLLDSITGYVGSPQGGNMLQALGMSLMSSPRNAPLANFGEFYGGLQKQQMQADERDQQRGAIAAALKSWGVPDSEAAILSANPSAAEIRINQLKAEKEKAERNQFLSGLGGLGGLGGTRPVADDVSSPPAVSDATAPQSAPSPAPVARQSLLGLPGAAQADYNHFRTDAAPPSDQYLEPVENIPQVPAQSQPPASGKPTADNLGLPASARQGAIMSGSDGKSYQYVQKSGGTDGVGEWGWTEVNLGGSQPKSGNKTMDYLQKNHPEVAALVNDQTGITPRDGLEIAQIQKQGQKRAADTQAQLDTLYQQRDSIARRLAMAPDQNAMQRAKIAYLDPLDAQIARLEKQVAIPKLTDDMREYDMARDQGFDGTFMDYMVKMKEAGRNQVNIDTGVKLPTGYRWTDPNDQTKGVEPIPGGPANVLPSEAAGRIGLADSFLNNFDSIRSKVASGQVTGPIDRFKATNDSSSEGAETYRQIQTGVDSLQRMLTGAGMPQTEAAQYAFRYLPTYTDDADSMVKKLDRLKAELEGVQKRVMQGRGSPSDASPPGKTGLPEGASEDDIRYTMEKYGLSREEVLRRLGDQ